MSEIPPVSAPPPGYYQRPRVDFESIGLAWKLIVADWGTWVLASLLVLLIIGAVLVPTVLFMYFRMFSVLLQMPRGGPFGPAQSQQFIANILLTYLLVIVLVLFASSFQTICFAGMMDMALKRMRGEPIVTTDVFAGFKRFGTLFLIGLITQIGVFVGAALCYIPAFLWLGLTSFAPLLVIRGKAKGLDSIAISWQLLSKDLWMITLLAFCAQFLSGIGSFACYIGMLFTFPIYPIVIALTYRNFFPDEARLIETPRA